MRDNFLSHRGKYYTITVYAVDSSHNHLASDSTSVTIAIPSISISSASVSGSSVTLNVSLNNAEHWHYKIGKHIMHFVHHYLSNK